MNCEYLLDASALYPLLKKLGSRLVLLAERMAVLDLTFYEAGNAAWRETRRGLITREQGERLLSLLYLAPFCRVLSIAGHEPSVYRLALSEGLTFYDASYLYAARLYNLKLVTEDGDLARYPEATRVDDVLREAGLEPR